MSDYDLPSEHRAALRQAKKKTTLGGAVILLSVFLPLLIKVSFYKRHAEEITRGRSPEDWISADLLLGAGAIGVVAGLGITAVGFVQEARVQKKIAAWREAEADAKPRAPLR